MEIKMKKTKSKTDIRPFTRQLFRGSAGCIILSSIETVINVVGSLLVAWLIQQIIDLIAGYDTGFTLADLTLITVLGIIGMAIAFLISYHATPRFITRGIAQYKEYVFNEITKKNISAFSGENSSLYISALSNDANAIETGYLSNIFPIIVSVLTFIGALVMMFLYSPILTLIAVALSLLPVLESVLVGGCVAKAEKNVSDMNESYMAALKDSLSGFSVIKSFKAEAQICRIFAGNVKKLAQAKCRKNKMTILVNMFAFIAGVIAQLGVFLLGAYLALTGRGVTVGTVMVFVQTMNYIINPIAVLPNYFAQCNAAKALIRKIADALAENVREENADTHIELCCSITLDNLSFGYEPEKPVLKNVNLTFEAGKKYAVVGASGSGKSTLLNLLIAGYQGYDGEIRYDDTELRNISSSNLYEIESIIQQNVFVFNASIRDNITMFSEFPEDEVRRAIEMSGLAGLIEAKGSDYLCGENGSGLSGGEKQRISIARSLLRKSRVLLVDEATSALDAETAYQVSSAILRLEGITGIVVTHTLDESLLRQYDCIVTLKNGSVVESGYFDELINKKGYFYSLFTVSQ